MNLCEAMATIARRKHSRRYFGGLVAILLISLFAPSAMAQMTDGELKGQKYIGHRFFVKKGIGWGWIKKPGQSWKKAQWVALRERPQQGIVAPHRKLVNASGDHQVEYELYGYWDDTDAYDPKWNELLPVFVLEGYKSLGPGSPTGLNPGSVARERDSNPNSKRRMKVRPNERGDWYD